MSPSATKEAISSVVRKSLIGDPKSRLQELIKSSSGGQRRRLIMVTGGGIAAQLLDVGSLAVGSLNAKEAEKEKKALKEFVTSWRGFFEYISGYVIWRNLFQGDSANSVKESLMTMTKLIMDNQLSLKAAKCHPGLVLDRNHYHPARLMNRQEFHDYRAQEDNGWAEFMQQMDPQYLSHPCPFGKAYQDQSKWIEKIKQMQKSHAETWRKDPSESRSLNAAADFLQSAPFRIAKAYGPYTFLHQHDSLKPLVEAVFVQKGFRGNSDAGKVKVLKALEQLGKDIPIFTTNVDNIQEQSMQRIGIDAEALYDLSNDKLVPKGRLGVQEHIDYLYDEKWRHQFWLYIVHLHGSYTGHDFVLSPDDHNRSLQRNQIVTLLQALVNRRSILFVGASDTIFDPHWMRLWLEELKKQKLYETTRQNSDQVDQHQAAAELEDVSVESLQQLAPATPPYPPPLRPTPNSPAATQPGESKSAWGIAAPAEHFMVVSAPAAKRLQESIGLIGIPQETLENESCEAALLFRERLPDLVRTLPAPLRQDLCRWMKDHLHFLEYSIKPPPADPCPDFDEHSGLHELLDELAKWSKKAADLVNIPKAKWVGKT